jgi:hypothetical protein
MVSMWGERHVATIFSNLEIEPNVFIKSAKDAQFGPRPFYIRDIHELNHE